MTPSTISITSLFALSNYPPLFTASTMPTGSKNREDDLLKHEVGQAINVNCSYNGKLILFAHGFRTGVNFLALTPKS
jgi:hypothetical protein